MNRKDLMQNMSSSNMALDNAIKTANIISLELKELKRDILNSHWPRFRKKEMLERLSRVIHMIGY